MFIYVCVCLLINVLSFVVHPHHLTCCFIFPLLLLTLFSLFKHFLFFFFWSYTIFKFLINFWTSPTILTILIPLFTTIYKWVLSYFFPLCFFLEQNFLSISVGYTKGIKLNSSMQIKINEQTNEWTLWRPGGHNNFMEINFCVLI